MALCADENPGSGQRADREKLSWPALLLMLAAVTSSSLSALCLYQLLALRAEVEGLKSDIYHRRDQQQETRYKSQTTEQVDNKRASSEPPHQPEPQPVLPLKRMKRLTDNSISLPLLQMLANSNRQPFEKEFDSETCTGIPWQAGLQTGTGLEVDGDTIRVTEAGFYFVYSQVYYEDRTFTMGHMLIRRKRNVVGDEPQTVILFRCIQNMSHTHPYNTCYTGGIVKLDVGDQVELLIPRPSANISLEGDSTFLGCVRLA